LLPVIQPRPGNGLDVQSTPLYDAGPSKHYGTWAQSASILPMVYGRELDPEVMKQDPFYAIHELFAFSAASEAQFLNMFETRINYASKTSHLDNKEPTLPELKTLMEIMNRHLWRLEENISILKRRGSPGWPQAEHLDLRKTADTAADNLLRDFEFLAERAKSLNHVCKFYMSVIMNDLLLKESQTSIQQARAVQMVTVATLIFLPLTFISTLFGMNVTEFGVGHVHFYLYLSITIPLALVTLLAWWMFQSERWNIVINYLRRGEYPKKSKVL
jgi:Mg2+ and Co2+ transporter CorA